MRRKAFLRSGRSYFFDGKLLLDAQTIASCGIQSDATLHLFATDYAAMKILIKMPSASNNKIITLEAKACETVDTIKLMIERKEGIQPNSFGLVYDGNVLEDERVLSSVGVRNNTSIHLVVSKKEVITLFVTAQGMEDVKLSVKVMFTVGDVKAIVTGMIGLRFSNNMNLFNAGQLLDDSKTLAFYDIKEGSSLDLLATSMQIFVEAWDGKTLTLTVRLPHTVEDIIKKVSQKLQHNIPDNVNISLFYAGKQLKRDKDLVSYGILPDSTLNMVLASYCLH